MARILAAITLATWLSSPALAEDDVTPTAAEPTIRIQAQLDLLPGGSGTFTTGNISQKEDVSATYAIGGSLDVALTPHLSIGVAPRLVYGIDSESNELDLRACIRGRTALRPGFDVYASFSPGYATLRSTGFATYRSKGFAIGGAVGFTYDLSPNLFVGGELGFQDSFTTTHRTLADDSIVYAQERQYLHLGMAVGVQF